MIDESTANEDPNAEYDRQHGDPAKNADHAKLVDLGEGSNKPAPAPVPFKITRG
jgi:hypothetical protein